MYKPTANYRQTLKRFTALAFLVFSCCVSFGQKNDYVWLSGYDSYAGYDSHWGFYFGASVLDFNYNPRQVNYDSLGMNFDFANTSFCDSDGHLLFYSNGIYVANSLDEKIENSDSLNAGYFLYEAYPDMKIHGYRTTQGEITIPIVTGNNTYHILHSWIDSVPGNYLCKKILFTELDMSANAGHGSVISKNQPIIGTGLLGWDLSAVKHANGKYWWALVQKRNTNCYYRILIDSNGVNLLPDLTCGGGVLENNDAGASCFSPDGSKYVYLSYFSGLSIFDFDRCNGELSNALTLPLPTLADQGWNRLGVAISPNSRFLYVSATLHLYQFDLQAADVLASIDTVGIFDTTDAPFGAYFHTAQNAPDGRIYISCGNGDTVYHVIERPDEKGDSCLFKQHSLSLPSPSFGVPNFPNYRLGALPGSPCDTLTGLNETARALKEKILKVFPNPASNMVTVDYGFTDWSKGDVRLTISDELGRVVYEQPLPKYSGFQNINVSTLAAGTYFVYLKRNGNTIAGEKMMKE